jgi:hypothetical protein
MAQKTWLLIFWLLALATASGVPTADLLVDGGAA